jgi:hypothetical protein
MFNIRPLGISRVRSVMAFAILMLSISAWADFEIYHKKGFIKAVEILEKKTNEDGTMRVKAKKANGEVVEIDLVTEIADVEAKTGMKDSGLVPPTPTPFPLPGQGFAHRPGGVAPETAPPVAPPPSERVDIEGVAENYRPDMNSVMENMKWVAMAIAGAATLVVVFFIFSKLTQ